MPGRVPHEDVESYYSIIDIAPLPRLPVPVTEAVSPIKPFEAMAMAKPVVVSSVRALQEIVTEGVNGRVFTKGDVDSLASVLGDLVEDEETRTSLGASAREWVVANRSWSVISTRIDEAYARIGVPGPR
jgi:glycosyltransferase involved in cell wall biosynthesis